MLNDAEQLAETTLALYPRDPEGNLPAPSKEEGIPHNVKRLVDSADALMWHLQFARLHVHTEAGDELREAAFSAHCVGRFHEALRVCQVEHVAKTGRKVRKGQRDGHVAVYGTHQDKQALWAAYQRTQSTTRRIGNEHRTSH